ncbi:hypothetical protein [Blautia hydrogenotrophica]|jgi:hypothetical protein|uniref:Uncharacterized protein n=1 Tax=Blautia hydrogenotrophica (strain DSM 10507 / JCM 14656 / S5a33) TaxID=476272 RepID=C0CMA9_BLAHS|nr:hypothetical protein [Blautia hydrogenotrophica]SCI29072.1 Uncharacterised protein [uncultured Blautia sp.]DAU19252.1 MAG TPA: RuvB-like protein 2 [Caudoviricetes sp.]EEG49179.1 hypothetical protein RUMHYD_01990 [Blautia hydrogenotrophica DSM 10507]MCT6798079.1 hypothetical protein [Blautia hydrogenotrophica]WPX84239.1 hypothetical protein BLHYD_22490 [Blautia hydrogenotrophica DSM 10507]
MEKGDIVYIVENRRKVTEVVIRSITGNLYTVLLPTGGAIRLPRGRIYKTRLEAEKQLVYKPIKKERTPYDYM